MSSTVPASENAKSASPSSPRNDHLWAILFNVGMALFLFAECWYHIDWPSRTATENAVKIFAIWSGLLLAGFAWLASSEIKFWQKVLNFALLFAITSSLSIEASREFNTDLELLKPGRIENGRFVHDSLGISFDVLPNWETNLQPVASQRVAERGSNSKSRSTVDQRLHIGQPAVFFRMRSSVAEQRSGLGDPSTVVQLMGGPIYFRSLPNVVAKILDIQQSYTRRPTVEMRRPVHFFQIGPLDVAEFEYWDKEQNVISRHVFVRSGPNLLDLSCKTNREEELARFDQIVRSIVITRRPTGFND